MIHFHSFLKTGINTLGREQRRRRLYFLPVVQHGRSLPSPPGVQAFPVHTQVQIIRVTAFIKCTDCRRWKLRWISIPAGLVVQWHLRVLEVLHHLSVRTSPVGPGALAPHLHPERFQFCL